MISNYMWKKLEREIRKIRIDSNEFSLSDFDSSKNEILEEFKKANHHDLEDMVHRMQPSYDEIMDILKVNYFPSKRTGFTLPPGLYEKSDINKTLEYDLPDNTITIDVIRLKSNIKNNQTLIFTKKVFFLHNIRFHSILFRSIG